MNRIRCNRFPLLVAGALLAAPLAAAAQTAPDIRSYAPTDASPGVPMTPRTRTAAVAPDVRSYAPTDASPGVPMSEPGAAWTARDDGSNASPGVVLRQAPAGNAVAAAPGARATAR